MDTMFQASGLLANFDIFISTLYDNADEQMSGGLIDQMRTILKNEGSDQIFFNLYDALREVWYT